MFKGLIFPPSEPPGEIMSFGVSPVNYSDSDSLFCLLMLYIFSFYSITPLCPYYVCSNPIIIIFSVDGHHLAFFFFFFFFFFFYRTEHNCSVFCNQKQGSTKNGTNANAKNVTKAALMQIYLAIYMALHIFFLARFARSVFKTLINVLYNLAQAQIHTSHSY